MSGQSWADYPKYLDPGEILEWQINGDFWYVKQGENLKITVFNQSCTGAQKGDGGSYDKPFDRIVVKNNTSYRQLVNLVIGFGEFDRKDVTGTIYAVTGLLDAEGNTYHDDRITEAVNLAITDATPFTITRGDLINTETLGFNVGSYGYYDPKDNLVYEGLSTGKYKKGSPGGSFDTITLTDPEGAGWVTANIGGYVFKAPDGFIYLFGGQFSGKDYMTKCNELGEIVDQYLLTENIGTSGIRGGLVDKNGTLYTVNISQNRLIKFNWGEQPTSIGGIGSGAAIALDSENNKIYTATATVHKEYDITTDTLTDTSADPEAGRIPTGAAHHMVIDNNQAFYVERVADNLETYQVLTRDYQGIGFVSVGNCQPLEILNRSSIANISADVTLTQESDRLVKVEGEVIKAILELYAAKVGGSVPTDYLDYIYAVKGAGLNVSSGNESFKRVGQADNFSLLSPAGLSITFSKRLLS